MALTEKGKIALSYVEKYFPNGESFCAKELSDKSGEKIYAATLNGVVNEGFLIKIGGSPVEYKAVSELKEMINNLSESSDGCDNTNLNKAKKEKNDEFYTRYEDIELEVMKYRKQFRDKIVYLPCDDPAEKKSEFWSFFVNNFDAFGLKKLIATHYSEDGKAYKIWIDGDLNGDGYVDDGDAQQEDLVGNGDFRSPECVEILEECDIVCTNPPFSMFREFVNWIITKNKSFLIIGNNNAISYKEIFPLIKNNKLWTGYTSNKTMTFKVGEGYAYDEKITKQINDGNFYGKVPAVSWFTNLKTFKRNEELILTAKYNPIDYPKYDNYDAIEVSKVVDIPKDYDGIMGVPITFIDKYNPDQFEIIGLDRYTVPKEFLVGGRVAIDGKPRYARILIRRKNYGN